MSAAPKKARPTQATRTVTAGCRACDATWTGPGAQGHAAHHHDTTKHSTWARVVMVVCYGTPAAPATTASPVRRRSRAWKR